MEFEVAIYQLSAEFIRNYPSQQYPELMYKKGRPYSCLLIDLHLDYFIYQVLGSSYFDWKITK